MSKSRGRTGMLGVGGQRRKISRRALRGGDAAAQGAGTDPVAQKKELLRKMRERAERRDSATDEQ
ncbi:DUF6243 family protein [Actinomadura verrucosospora]|uniref:Uncharacterized protein n=1 Tax=Actinomadura verrucosospora TaxID=46165 RepID=A0A7D3W062_ACTVE|nr:DUF6243 family protein [Actinomadura verrucosospora]QKG23112.1 hypothetical protein ACTIVE_4753 [Actinomadura verrucosospora]